MRGKKQVRTLILSYPLFWCCCFHVRDSKIFLDSEFHAVDSGFQSLVGFWIPWAVFRNPKPRIRIPQAKISWIPESGFHEANSLSVLSMFASLISSVFSRAVFFHSEKSRTETKSAGLFPEKRSVAEPKVAEHVFMDSDVFSFILFCVLWFRFGFCDSVFCFVTLFCVLWFRFRFCDFVLCFWILFCVLWLCFLFCDSVLWFVLRQFAILFCVLWFCFVPIGHRI